MINLSDASFYTHWNRKHSSWKQFRCTGNPILNCIKRQIYNKCKGIEDTVLILVNTCHNDDSQLSLVGQLEDPTLAKFITLNG